MSVQSRLSIIFKRSAQLAATATLGLCTGCGLIRQLTSPNLAKLYSLGATTTPDRDELISFTRRPMNDDDFAEAYRYLKAYEPKHLNFDGRGIGDSSVSLLIQLDSVERLDLQGTRISKSGLMRLRLMRNLNYLGISDSFSPEDMSEIQAALTSKVRVVRAFSFYGSERHAQAAR